MATSKECPFHNQCGLVDFIQKKLEINDRNRGKIDCGTDIDICPRTPYGPFYWVKDVKTGPRTARELILARDIIQTQQKSAFTGES